MQHAGKQIKHKRKFKIQVLLTMDERKRENNLSFKKKLNIYY